MVRAFFSEWLAFKGIQWTFTLHSRLGRWAAWISALFFTESQRGTWLSVYFLLIDGKIDQVFSRLQGYYSAGRKRAEWGLRLGRWSSEVVGSNPFVQKIALRLHSLASSWQQLQPVPRQVQAFLQKSNHFSELSELADASGQSILQAHSLFMGGKPEVAIKILACLPPEKWNGEAAYVQARSLQALGHELEAVQGLEKFLLENGGGQESYQLLKELYLHTGRRVDNLGKNEKIFEKDFRHLLKIKPIEVGRAFHLITEDHELTTTPGKSEGNPFLSLREARIQLIEKGRLVNRIANNHGTPWTHLIDIGSYTILKMAAEQYPHTWGDVFSEFITFLVDTIKTGNDLGVHVHPDKSWLAVKKIESDRVWLKRGIPGWGDLPCLGFSGDLSSKLGLILEGKRLIEQSARKIKPGFQAFFFRSGSYCTGSTLFETAESMDALLKAGLWMGSDALEMDGITESLGRNKSVIYSAVGETPWFEKQKESGIIQVLPLRSKDFPVYSVVDAARNHMKKNNFFSRLEKMAESIGYVVSMDHEIEIGNARAGGHWDDLDPDNGDWFALNVYLEAVGHSKIFNCIGANDLMLV